MSNKKPAPSKYTEEVWRDLRHDWAQCVRSMENIGKLLARNAIPIDEASHELLLLSKQAERVYKTIFEEDA